VTVCIWGFLNGGNRAVATEALCVVFETEKRKASFSANAGTLLHSHVVRTRHLAWQSPAIGRLFIAAEGAICCRNSDWCWVSGACIEVESVSSSAVLGGISRASKRAVARGSCDATSVKGVSTIALLTETAILAKVQFATSSTSKQYAVIPLFHTRHQSV
jgi:hypothetical protein